MLGSIGTEIESSSEEFYSWFDDIVLTSCGLGWVDEIVGKWYCECWWLNGGDDVGLLDNLWWFHSWLVENWNNRM